MRALFLDRDGTVIVDKGYLADPDGVEFLPGALEGIRRFAAAGYLVILITNQSGVGRGMFTAAEAEAVNHRTVEMMAGEGISVAGVYYCPHAPDDPCSCRKPLPGMLLQAARELGVDLARSVMLGDKEADSGAGRAAGCAWSLRIGPGGPVDLVEAANRILG